MSRVSSFLATVLFVWAISIFVDRLWAWQRVPVWQIVSTGGVSAYAGVAMITGWRYIETGRKVFGSIHAAQMLVVASASAIILLYSLCKLPAVMYSGPAAGAGVGGLLVLGVTILSAFVGVVFGACGLGVLRHISLQSESESSVLAEEQTLVELPRRFPYGPKR
jgi:hypothetical protein